MAKMTAFCKILLQKCVIIITIWKAAFIWGLLCWWHPTYVIAKTKTLIWKYHHCVFKMPGHRVPTVANMAYSMFLSKKPQSPYCTKFREAAKASLITLGCYQSGVGAGGWERKEQLPKWDYPRLNIIMHKSIICLHRKQHPSLTFTRRITNEEHRHKYPRTCVHKGYQMKIICSVLIQRIPSIKAAHLLQ